MAQYNDEGFRGSDGLTKATKWSLYFQIGIAVIAIVSGVLEYQLLLDFKNGVFNSQELIIAAAEANDTRQRVISVVQIMVLVISGVIILKWIHRANYNARKLGATDMIFTPGWSIGWYFIPIVCLWKPYQAMKEIWKASSNPTDWKNQSVSSLLPWWWFFWILSGVLGNISLRLSIGAVASEKIDDLIVVNLFCQAADISGVLLGLMMIGIVNGVYKMQMAHASLKNSPQSYGARSSRPQHSLAGAHRWIIAGFDSNGHVIRLPFDETNPKLENGGLFIGRDISQCDLVINDNTVSRKHAILSGGNGTIFIEDAGSSNGTKLNGRNLDRGTKLAIKPGDNITFGLVQVDVAN